MGRQGQGFADLHPEKGERLEDKGRVRAFDFPFKGGMAGREKQAAREGEVLLPKRGGGVGKERKKVCLQQRALRRPGKKDTGAGGSAPHSVLRERENARVQGISRLGELSSSEGKRGMKWPIWSGDLIP